MSFFLFIIIILSFVLLIAMWLNWVQKKRHSEKKVWNSLNYRNASSMTHGSTFTMRFRPDENDGSTRQITKRTRDRDKRKTKKNYRPLPLPD
jgi:hypothetical protein